MSNEEHSTATTDANASSLLEDASVLLMFHNAAVTGTNEQPQPPSQSPSQPQPQPQPRAAAPTVAPVVAPAVPSNQALPMPNHQTPKPPSPFIQQSSNSTSSNKSSESNSRIPTPKINNLASPGPAIAALADSSGEHGSEGENKNQKAIVAAAALAAAAGIPLPLMTKTEETATLSIDQHLRSAGSQVPSSPSLETTKMDEELKKEETEDEATQSQDTEMKDADDETTGEETQDEKDDKDENDEKEEKQGKLEPESRPEQEQEPEQNPVKPLAPKRNRKPKRKQTTPKGYIVDVDAGIITCICSFDHDDGFTIQCDICHRWQHGVCMGIEDDDKVPDDYYCSVCQPRTLDVKRAQELQTEILEMMKKGRGGKSAKGASDINDKEANQQSGTAKPKTKVTPPPQKNLDETDIKVLDYKEAYLTQYFPLETYDFQDFEVSKYVAKLAQSRKEEIKVMAESEYESLKKPTLTVKAYSEVNSKKFNGISKMGLFSESNLMVNDIIDEYLGEINFKDRYIQDSRNHYRIWGVEKPYVVFIPKTFLVIDARNSGNFTRFIRRGCHPNVSVKPINVGNELKFVVYALKPIKANTELVFGWNWDPNHSIRAIQEGANFEQTSDADKPSLILSIESILTFVECACGTGSDCCLAKVKRASSHIHRTSRKNNNGTGTKRFQPAGPVHVPIQKRLLEREASNIRDAANQAKHVSILTSQGQDDIGIRPFIYKYLTVSRKLPPLPSTRKKRIIDESEAKLEYLPIPLPLSTTSKAEVEKVVSVAGGTEMPPAKKKLSFADYKMKKKLNQPHQ